MLQVIVSMLDDVRLDTLTHQHVKTSICNEKECHNTSSLPTTIPYISPIIPRVRFSLPLSYLRYPPLSLKRVYKIKLAETSRGDEKF